MINKNSLALLVNFKNICKIIINDIRKYVNNLILDSNIKENIPKKI